MLIVVYLSSPLEYSSSVINCYRNAVVLGGQGERWALGSDYG